MKHAFQDDPTPKQLLDGQDFCPFIPVFGAPKVMFEKGKGTELWASDGKRYLDFLSGIAVVSLGHCN
ncbi:MAG: acetylornithine aminotransferase, partial [Actinomycetota bacterium]